MVHGILLQVLALTVTMIQGNVDYVIRTFFLDNVLIVIQDIILAQVLHIVTGNGIQ